ncbi:hypothetical protein RJ639_021380 [Escallonia herrerae]|uniref:Transposase (putative) gypsy type domain-containing protein n=1 Tax=Escallonia herrerae TaxID=1293975 RepID=A0AA88V2Y9_9ASTE|nr:hypothetical protein RJ639_021380 [Escallonia herrerae]
MAECSDDILFGQNVLGFLDSARSECSDGILPRQNVLGLLHSARGECSDGILLGENVLGLLHSAGGECSDGILLGENVLGLLHSAGGECSDGILFGQNVIGLLHSARGECSDGDVKDQAEDKAIPKPWYTADEKSSKMSAEDLQELIREYPLPAGWLPLHPFALRFFEHYHMAPGQLVPNGWRKLAGLIYLVQTSGYKPDATNFMRVFFKICFVKGVANCPGWYYIHSRQRLLKGGPKSNKGWHSRYFFVGRLDKGKLPFDRDWNPYCKDFENPGKPSPNNLTRHILSHIKLRGGLSIDEPLLKQQLEWANIIPQKPIPAGLLIPPPPHIYSMSSAETVPLEMACESGKSPKGGFLGVLQKAKGKRKEKQPSAELPLHRRRQLGRGAASSSWNSSSRQGGLPESDTRDLCLFLRPGRMYASGSEMISRFEMARQVAAEEAQQKRDAVKEAQEATHRAEELIKRKAAEEVTKARDQGIRDFLDGNAGDEWLRKRTEDGLEIYELGFTKAKDMFAERFPDIPLEDFVLPAVASPSREIVMPSEAGDAAASHPLGEGPSGDAPVP